MFDLNRYPAPTTIPAPPALPDLDAYPNPKRGAARRGRDARVGAVAARRRPPVQLVVVSTHKVLGGERSARERLSHGPNVEVVARLAAWAMPCTCHSHATWAGNHV